MYSNIPVRLFFLAERRQETINQEGEKRFKFRNQSRKKKELRERPFPVSTPKSYANSARPNANRIEANLGTVILKSLSRRARSISLTKVRDDGTVRISRALPPSVHPFHLIKKEEKKEDQHQQSCCIIFFFLFLPAAHSRPAHIARKVLSPGLMNLGSKANSTNSVRPSNI